MSSNETQTDGAAAPRAPAPSPWHRGERALHERMGNAAQMESVGRRVIRDFMPEQHRLFYPQLPFIVAGAVDGQGRPWATLIEGPPGFIESPEPRRLDIGARPGAGDPLREAWVAGAQVGLLGIELHTRRRNRLNGRLIEGSDGGLAVQVDQTFGNCPQYIQQRGFAFAHEPGAGSTGPVEAMNALDEAARQAVAAADTFFVASQFPGDAEHPEPAVDVSHRGGRPGFVKIVGEVLHIPDFAGNLHFNTFGNLLLNPRAGLLFVDFSTGDLLQLSGRAELVFEGPEIAAFQGAERMWTFTVEHLVRRRRALALRWTLDEPSPHSLMTGSWDEASAKLQAATLQQAWRPMRVTRIVPESSTVRSFYLEPADGFATAAFLAGQHLPIRLQIPGEDRPLIRCYTLSVAPSDGVYRLSIKRQGRVSRHLHDSLRVGNLIEARAPRGDFTIDALQRRPAVLLAGGIGVTPMLAMLRHIVFEGLRKRRLRPTTFIYATHNQAERAFDAELAELARRGGDALKIVRVTAAPEAQARPGHDFELQGRVDLQLLRQVLPFGDHDFYLCGPPPFMQALYDTLREQRVMDDRIHAEAFGPAGLQRRDDAPADAPAAAPPPVATGEVQVLFSASGLEARWTPASGSLLELAEQGGLAPEFGCRGGACGSCKTQVLEGEVSYLRPPACKTGPGEALLCCAMPAQGQPGQSPPRLVLKA